MNERPAAKVSTAIGLLSAALIAFQLALMQILSLAQWHHYAWMMISVALLGFGVSGTILALFRRQLLASSNILLPQLAILTGVFMLLTGLLGGPLAESLDPHMLFIDMFQGWKLLFACMLLMLPFVPGSLVIGLAFTRWTECIGTLYFYNLVGSGIGGLLAVGLSFLFFPSVLPFIIALLPCAAALLLTGGKPVLTAAAVLVALLCASVAVSPVSLHLSQYKELSKALDLPDAEIVYAAGNPEGVVHIVRSPVQRYAPGLSLTYTGDIPAGDALFLNGSGYGPVTIGRLPDGSVLLDYATHALPYTLRTPRQVLILDTRSGLSTAQAESRGDMSITALNPHTLISKLLQKQLAPQNNSLFLKPGIRLITMEARNFLSGDTTHYDLIVHPDVGTFGGSGGLHAMHEQYSLTVEAFGAMWDRLTPDGCLAVTVWMDYPWRAPLRIATTLASMLENKGVRETKQHVAAVRSWATMTFVLSRKPLRPIQIQNIRLFCDSLHFDPALLPDIVDSERSRYNSLQDEELFTWLDTAFSLQRDALLDRYPFKIAPATDDRPFFGQFLRWKYLAVMIELAGARTLPYFELGSLLVGMTLVVVCLAALILILLPLMKLGWQGRGRGWTIVYFTGLGLGYMFLEIVLIQQFTLYLGHPLYATASIISCMLVCSGFGSYLSGHLQSRKKMLWLIPFVILILITSYALWLPLLIASTVHLSLPVKAVSVFIILLPASCAMGIPFPLGLRSLKPGTPEAIPWAWGINSSVSVVAAPLAMLLAMEFGFNIVIAAAAGSYAMAAAVSIRRIPAPRL